ncbi:hypothetical protein GPUN_1664 [Glaciecola punicea ACAM 611]|uniref:Uncharacterized protein n=1 Tax=Glaciecola punicea ACAM 611 TaxID=1121923 RepID=H5TBV4_9ALTE|nr:hypothetical protein GPUN_1664 [Glaciecola punicea ACAM 611]
MIQRFECQVFELHCYGQLANTSGFSFDAGTLCKVVCQCQF